MHQNLFDKRCTNVVPKHRLFKRVIALTHVKELLKPCCVFKRVIALTELLILLTRHYYACLVFIVPSLLSNRCSSS